MKELNKLSVFELLNELLRQGSAGISKAEPFVIDDLVRRLEKTTGKRFGQSVDRWVEWFCSDETQFDSEEKESLGIIKRLVDAENKYLPKIKGAGNLESE